LRELGCVLGQGDLFAKPLERDSMADLVARKTGRVFAREVAMADRQGTVRTKIGSTFPTAWRSRSGARRASGSCSSTSTTSRAVNDTLGYAAGDQLLVDVASRLRVALRTGDTAARAGGDDFVVLLDEVRTTEAVLVVAECLGESLRAPDEIGTDGLVATVSIGVAVGPDSLKTADDVVAAADAAMYDAKRRGGGRCVIYREDLHG
jgi:diguanylate cyclase (GGDEF)-like protein